MERNPENHKFFEKRHVFFLPKFGEYDDSLGSRAKAFATHDSVTREKYGMTPEGDVHEFLDIERDTAQKTLRFPLRNIIDGTREGIKSLGRGVRSVVQAPISATTGAVGHISSGIGNMVASILDFAGKVITRPPASAVAFVSNTVKHAIDLTVRLPGSLINIAGSYAGRLASKPSAYAKSAQEKIDHWRTAGTDKIRNAGNWARSQVDKVKIPDFGFLQPQPMAA